MLKRKLDKPPSSAVLESVPVISSDNPLEEYKLIVKNHMQNDDDPLDDFEISNNFKNISIAARKLIWELLFGKPATNESSPVGAEQLKRGGELMAEFKSDCCFYGPWEYNSWIGSIRNEMIKRNMVDFWRDTIVKSELGPCWARDSDYFDDMDDPNPALFYDFAGCVAPFVSEATNATNDAAQGAQDKVQNNMSEGKEPSSPYKDFDAKIETIEDYQNLIMAHVQKEERSDEVVHANYQKIASAARLAIWQMLFSAKSAINQPDPKKIAEFLEEHKVDAAFYSPWEYNEWIVKIRDELLARGNVAFWRDYIVRLELGPCWAKDSDFFDDEEDTDPSEFYEYAGCVAPFKKLIREEDKGEDNEDDNKESAAKDTAGDGVATKEPVEVEDAAEAKPKETVAAADTKDKQ